MARAIHHELVSTKRTRYYGLMRPEAIHCNMEMIDLESGTSRSRGHKKVMWVPTFMSSSSVSPTPLTLIVIKGGWLF